MRRRNLIADDAYPYASAAGLKFEKLSHHESLAHLDSLMNYAGLRAEQKKLREQGIYRGIGFASFIEVTNPSAAFYGVGGARITSQDGATVKLDAQGNISRGDRRHRAGPGRRSRGGAMRRHLVRRFDRHACA